MGKLVFEMKGSLRSQCIFFSFFSREGLLWNGWVRSSVSVFCCVANATWRCSDEFGVHDGMGWRRHEVEARVGAGVIVPAAIKIFHCNL